MEQFRPQWRIAVVVGASKVDGVKHGWGNYAAQFLLRLFIIISREVETGVRQQLRVCAFGLIGWSVVAAG